MKAPAASGNTGFRSQRNSVMQATPSKVGAGKAEKTPRKVEEKTPRKVKSPVNKNEDKNNSSLGGKKDPLNNSNINSKTNTGLRRPTGMSNRPGTSAAVTGE